MAKRTTTPKTDSAPKTASKKAAPAAAPAETTVDVVATSPVRKTVAPKKASSPAVAAAAPAPITYERIAERAYFISISGTGGSEHDNWCRAEEELKKEAGL
jgi:hypothetical protein